MHSTNGGVSCLDVIKAVAALFFTDEVIFCLLVMYYTVCTHSGNELETQVNPPHPFTPMLCDYFRRFWPSGDAHRRGLAHLASHLLRRRHRRLGDGGARGVPVPVLNAIEAWPWPTSGASPLPDIGGGPSPTSGAWLWPEIACGPRPKLGAWP